MQNSPVLTLKEGSQSVMTRARKRAVIKLLSFLTKLAGDLTCSQGLAAVTLQIRPS